MTENHFQCIRVSDSKTFTVKTVDLQFFPMSEGFYDYKKDQYIYQYKDYLGNVRVNFAINSAGALEITDNNDYYPFGNHLKSGNAFFGQNSYKSYKYNGKELQETGMYDYGARMYMADIGRCGVVDPLSEKGHNFSPYNYAINNPINFIDPDGLWISITDGDNKFRYSKGQTQHLVDGKWMAADNVTLSDNLIGIISGLQAIESGGEAGAGIISYYNKNHDINIQSTTDENSYNNGTAYVNLSLKSNYPTSDGQVSDSPFYIKLAHEMAHGMNPMKKSDLFGPWVGGKTETKSDDISHSEIFASHIENKLRAENKLPLRVSYRHNPANKTAKGVDVHTMLIDSTGNSIYFNGYGQNLQTQLKFTDVLNAYYNYIGSEKPLKGRFNYYDNAKKQKK